MDLPHRAIREQIAAALDLIIQLSRMRDGSRKCIAVTEVQGMEGDIVTMSDIFKFEATGFEGGKVLGELRSTGLRPMFMSKLEAAGIHLPPSIFGVGQRRRY
jgi:pilus assembly protein CpaF